jgi:VanZ family protein
MIKILLSRYPTSFRIAFTVYALIILWASLRTGGGPQPIEHFDKVMHFAFYGLFTVMAAGCTTKRKTFIQISIFITFYGVLMEILQSFVPSRFMSLADIVANTIGVIIVVALFLWRGVHNQPIKK